MVSKWVSNVRVSSPRLCVLRFMSDSCGPTDCYSGFPGGSEGKEPACNAGDLGRNDPLAERMATHSSIIAWEIS